MQTFAIYSADDLNKLRENTQFFDTGCVVALGFFDGVHIAHKILIKEAKEEAEKKNLPLVVFTFSADSKNLKPSQPRLFTDREKLLLFEAHGADAVLLCNFELFKDMPNESFVKDFLVDKINTNTAVFGFNFRFGKNALGNADILEKELSHYGRETKIIPEFQKDGITVSSSLIRDLLSSKRMREASSLLGEPYFISGTVSHGLGLGTKLGIPTVNLPIERNKFTLPNGVYLSALTVDGKLYFGMTNVGICPTFDEREKHAETFIFDFNGNLYESEIKVFFVEFLREEKKFSTPEELIMQINVDKKNALQLIKEIKWQEIGLN